MLLKLKTLSIVSLLMMIGALYLVKLKYDKLGVLENGQEVTVTIVDIPVKCGEGSRSSKSHFRFRYLGKTYRKNFNGMHCEITDGDKIVLKTDNEQSVFLFTDETKELTLDIAAFIGLALMFAFCAFYNERRKDKTEIVTKSTLQKKKKT